MNHPLLLTSFETEIAATGVTDTLVLVSPFGATYRVKIDPISATNIKLAIAAESKLVAAIEPNGPSCDQCGHDDEEPPMRYPGNRISRN